MDAREKSVSPVSDSKTHKRVPIFVMMPVDTFAVDASGSPRIKRYDKALSTAVVYYHVCKYLCW